MPGARVAATSSPSVAGLMPVAASLRVLAGGCRRLGDRPAGARAHRTSSVPRLRYRRLPGKIPATAPSLVGPRRSAEPPCCGRSCRRMSHAGRRTCGRTPVPLPCIGCTALCTCDGARVVALPRARAARAFWLAALAALTVGAAVTRVRTSPSSRTFGVASAADRWPGCRLAPPACLAAAFPNA